MQAQAGKSEQGAAERVRIGRYQVTGTLGSGAMGTVYRAEDPLIERKVALKVLSLDLSEQQRAQFREHFFREGKAAGRLNHPNIVTIYDIGESDGVPYIAMEYLQGLTLREALDMGTVMPVRRVVDIGLAVCRGLDFAHGHGVIHRDIKPANVMLTRSGVVKIMDFGIAHAHFGFTPEPNLPAGQVLGTPKYMAPEQVSGASSDARADLFSLAVTLYELLVGRNPFEAGTIQEVIDKVLHLEPPTARELNPDVPRGLDLLLLRAMQKDPVRRFESAREMGKVLRGLRRELRAATDKPSMPKVRVQRGAESGAATLVLERPAASLPGTPEPRRRPRKAGLAVLVALTLALGAGLAVLLPTGLPEGPAVDLPSEATPAAAPEPAPETLAVPQVEPIVPVDESAPDGLPLRSEPPRRAGVAPSVRGSVQEPAVLGRATVALSILPWGEVFVDGRPAGVTPPLRELALTPGRHRVEVRNLDFPPFVAELQLSAGAERRLQHRFGR